MRATSICVVPRCRRKSAVAIRRTPMLVLATILLGIRPTSQSHVISTPSCSESTTFTLRAPKSLTFPLLEGHRGALTAHFEISEPGSKVVLTRRNCFQRLPPPDPHSSIVLAFIIQVTGATDAVISDLRVNLPDPIHENSAYAFAIFDGIDSTLWARELNAHYPTAQGQLGPILAYQTLSRGHTYIIEVLEKQFSSMPTPPKSFPPTASPSESPRSAF